MTYDKAEDYLIRAPGGGQQLRQRRPQGRHPAVHRREELQARARRLRHARSAEGLSADEAAQLRRSLERLLRAALGRDRRRVGEARRARRSVLANLERARLSPAPSTSSIPSATRSAGGRASPRSPICPTASMPRCWRSRARACSTRCAGWPRAASARRSSFRPALPRPARKGSPSSARSRGSRRRRAW